MADHCFRNTISSNASDLQQVSRCRLFRGALFEMKNDFTQKSYDEDVMTHGLANKLQVFLNAQFSLYSDQKIIKKAIPWVSLKFDLERRNGDYNHHHDK